MTDTTAMRPDHDLDAAAATFWELLLAASPRYATTLGDRRFDDRLEDRSPEASAKLAGSLRALRARVSELTARDWVTRAELIAELDGQLGLLDAALEEWTIDPLEGPQVHLPNLTEVQAIGSPAQAAMMVDRWLAIGPYLDQEIANLRRGLAAGRTATIDPVRRALEQLAALERTPLERSPFLAPLGEAHPDWSAAERDRFSLDLTAAVRDVVMPAFVRYRIAIEAEVLPAARPADRPGIGHLDGGAEIYRRLIRLHTTRDLDPERIHAIGREEIARIDTELVALGGRVLGTHDLPSTLDALRSDPEVHFVTGEEIVAVAERSLARASAALPDWFGRLPRTPCEVVRIPDHEAPHSTIAYYLPPAKDGARPGRYYVNTHAPSTRPRYEAEALAFHESIPGHHLQIAIAQELTDLPEFRRNLGSTAFVEGWGLYTERLADEMGLYSTDLDRLGILSFDAWRACRLVVDTGIHAHGLDAPSRGDRVTWSTTRRSPATTSRTRWTGTSCGPARRSATRSASSRSSGCGHGGAAARVGLRHPGLPRRRPRRTARVSLRTLRGIVEAWIEAGARTAPRPERHRAGVRRALLARTTHSARPEDPRMPDRALPYDLPSRPGQAPLGARSPTDPTAPPARAMLKAIGFTDEDLAQPIIGVATTWIETMPCNYNQRGSPSSSRRASARPAARRWSSTRSPSATA